jgi:paraquat-inducible protein B
MKMDRQSLNIRIPVLISIQPQHFDESLKLTEAEVDLEKLVKKGMRAKLETASLLTGQKLITLSMEKTPTPALITKTQFYSEFPTVASVMDDLPLMASHLDEVLVEAKDTVKAATAVLKTVNQKTLPSVTGDIHTVSGNINSMTGGMNKVVDELQATLKKLQGTLAQVDGLTARNSPTQYQLQEMLTEVTAASRSVRTLTETLQRKPESLLRGKGGD